MARYHRGVSGARGWSPRRIPLRRVARLFGWNALFLFIGLALVAGGAEAYLRLTAPTASWWDYVTPVQLAPGVGVLWAPGAEIRHTNERDYWQVSHANSLGFLGREPPHPERAAGSCHVTLIGDSVVEGKEVRPAQRLRAQLEALTARELPELDVTVSAFAYGGTGQINQLAFYDAHARTLSPDLLVLVLVRNDFRDNSLPVKSYDWGTHPAYPPYLFARWGAEEEMVPVPPAADMEELRANRLPVSPEPATFGRRVERRAREWSHLADWLWDRTGGGSRGLSAAQQRERVELIGRHWPVEMRPDEFVVGMLPEDNPPAVAREALDVLVFALEQFRERAERDGAELIILTGHNMEGEGYPLFDLLRELVAGIGGGEIPVISQYEYILAAGGEIADVRWEHDYHWNATGHLRAAEAILEWLKEHPEVCD